MKANQWTIWCVLPLFWACGKSNPSPNEQCNVMQQQAGWTVEDFKTGYTIQFPDYYDGHGMFSFEGNTFARYYPFEGVFFDYSFCGPLYCEDFGAPLPALLPGRIVVNHPADGEEYLLHQRKDFCRQGEQVGVLYFSDTHPVYSRYYMLEKDTFRAALNIEYRSGSQTEIETIIQTIHPR